ncbi:MAG: helix-turn-helix domain-containing protein [Pseudonocardia sp.]
MTARPVNPALGELGGRLRALREQAGHTGVGLAETLGAGWGQSKVSKIERGRQLPSEAEIAAWTGVTGGDPGPLTALRAQAATAYRSSKDRIGRAGGAVAHQQNLTDLAESCTFIGEFQPALVPGYLQTAAYMREKSLRDPTMAEDGIPPETLGSVIAAKIRRQAILYEPGREFVHVVTEAALRLRFGVTTATTMRGQLTHLAELATLPGHTFGVLPFDVPCPMEPTGFQLYDRDLVVIETVGGALEHTDPDSVARYARWLDQLVDAALTSSAAADFCRTVAASLPD